MLNISKLKLNKINNNIIKDQGELNDDIVYKSSSSKEWFNSIYSYYKNNQKSIPALDILIYKIIKNYFNMYSSRLERSIFLRKKSNKRRRYRLNKILISKPEFKHTNDKVKITLYVYNTELSFLNVKIRNLKKRILAQYFYKIFTSKYITLSKLSLIKSLIKRVNLLKKYIKNLRVSRNKDIIKWYKRNNILIARKTINEYNQEWSYIKYLSSYMRRNRLLRVGHTLNRFEKNARKMRFFFKRRSRKLATRFNTSTYLSKYVKVKDLRKSINIIRYLSVLFSKLDDNICTSTIKYYHEKVKNMPIFSISKKVFIKKIRKIIFRLKLLLRYNRIITFNKLKFNTFLAPLKSFLELIYKKDVEFDIVTVKNYKLNSSLLTQVMAIKLKNRKVKLLRVINRILSKIRLPITRRYDYLKEIPKNRFRQSIILRKNLNKAFISNIPLVNLNLLKKELQKNRMGIDLNKISYHLNKGDTLNLLLKSIYSSQITLVNRNIFKSFQVLSNKEISSSLLLERNLENIVLDSIKNKSITGIKIEASGRLTKRIVAARSTHKIKQKGTIKNINSSYKKLSSLLLRGNLKSNTQFAKANNKTRIGSFGLKGWISSI